MEVYHRPKGQVPQKYQTSPEVLRWLESTEGTMVTMDFAQNLSRQCAKGEIPEVMWKESINAFLAQNNVDPRLREGITQEYIESLKMAQKMQKMAAAQKEDLAHQEKVIASESKYDKLKPVLIALGIIAALVIALA